MNNRSLEKQTPSGRRRKAAVDISCTPGSHVVLTAPRQDWSMIRLALLANLIVLLLLAPVAAHAADIRQGSNVVVAAGETVDDDVIAAGQTVTIAGHVTGDVYTGAQTVLVSGTI